MKVYVDIYMINFLVWKSAGELTFIATSCIIIILIIIIFFQPKSIVWYKIGLFKIALPFRVSGYLRRVFTRGYLLRLFTKVN